MPEMPKCKITGFVCPAWSDFDGCGLEICRFKLNGLAANRKPYTPPTAEVVPITNEMHLRTMSREEWVEVLYSLYLHSADFDCGEISLLWCDGKDNCYDEDGEILCNEERHKACILRWLQSPYKPKEAADA